MNEKMVFMTKRLRRQYLLISESIFTPFHKIQAEVLEQNSGNVKFHSTELDLSPILSSHTQGISKQYEVFFLTLKVLIISLRIQTIMKQNNRVTYRCTKVYIKIRERNHRREKTTKVYWKIRKFIFSVTIFFCLFCF